MFTARANLREGLDRPFIALVRNTWVDLARYAESCDLADMVPRFSSILGQISL